MAPSENWQLPVSSGSLCKHPLGGSHFSRRFRGNLLFRKACKSRAPRWPWRTHLECGVTQIFEKQNRGKKQKTKGDSVEFTLNKSSHFLATLYHRRKKKKKKRPLFLAELLVESGERNAFLWRSRRTCGLLLSLSAICKARRVSRLKWGDESRTTQPKYTAVTCWGRPPRVSTLSLRLALCGFHPRPSLTRDQKSLPAQCLGLETWWVPRAQQCCCPPRSLQWWWVECGGHVLRLWEVTVTATWGQRSNRLQDNLSLVSSPQSWTLSPILNPQASTLLAPYSRHAPAPTARESKYGSRVSREGRGGVKKFLGLGKYTNEPVSGSANTADQRLCASFFFF